MEIEHLAILGIGIFAFIALVQGFSTVRSIKRSSQKKVFRYRRPVGSEASALGIARGLVREVRERHGPLVEQARESGNITPELEPHLEEARQYYRERVEPRLRPLFHQVVNEMILNRDEDDGSKKESSPE